MSDTELQFRTSTFGGFQKQDVLNYIETSNQEHREKLEAVRRELAEAEAAKAAQAEETAAAQAQTEAKEKELQALREELAAAHKEAEERKLEISLLEEELEKAKQRLADTAPPVSSWRPTAAPRRFRRRRRSASARHGPRWSSG